MGRADLGAAPGRVGRRPPPLPGFPFPGQVATDRLHWLKRQYKQSEDDPAKALPLLDRLVAAQPARWYVARGDANNRLGRWAAAVDDYLAGKADIRSIALNWARYPGPPAERHRAALRLAEAARQADPGNWETANVLGMALYRAGRDREAVRALTEAGHLYRLGQHARHYVSRVLLSPWAGLAADPTATDHPFNLAFLAMAHHRLGEADLARARLADLREATAYLQFGDEDTEPRTLLKEVEAALAAPPAPPPK